MGYVTGHNVPIRNVFSTSLAWDNHNVIILNVDSHCGRGREKARERERERERERDTHTQNEKERREKWILGSEDETGL